MGNRPALRSLLFVPGHRESMLDKAPALPADAVVFDLEDSVPSAEKATARERVQIRLSDWNDGLPMPFVRINPPRYGAVREDISTLLGHKRVGVVVPKVDRVIELAPVFDALDGTEREVIVTIETPRSLLRVEEFADAPGVTGIFLGGEDLTNALGMRRTEEGDELSWARFVVLAAARAAGIAAYDTISPEFRDLDALTRDCQTAAAYGFDGKFAIHPAQLPIIHDAFTPSDEEIDRARRIVSAYDEAVRSGHGAVEVDGQMVDPPVAERSRALLHRAQQRQ